MQYLYERLIGAVALLFGGKLLIDAIAGQAGGGARQLAGLVGGAPGFALALSVGLGLLGVYMGLRAIIWKRVCVGGTCAVDQTHR